MLWQITNNINNINFHFLKKDQINFIEDFKKQHYYSLVNTKSPSKHIRSKFKKFLKTKKINRFLINHNLMKYFTLNYNNIRKINIKRFSKKYKIKWFKLTINSKNLKISPIKKKKFKKYIISKNKIKYSTKKKKKRLFLRKFRTKRERYFSKDWRPWHCTFIKKLNYKYSKKKLLKYKNYRFKYNLYNLNRKIFTCVDDKKPYNISQNENFKNINKNLKKVIKKINKLQKNSNLQIKQDFEYVKEYDNTWSIRWYKRFKFLKTRNKPKLTKNAKRRIKKRKKKQQRIKRLTLKFRKKFKKFLRKPVKRINKKTKIKRLKLRRFNSKFLNIFAWSRRASHKHNLIFNGNKGLILRFIRTELARNTRMKFQSIRQWRNFYNLNHWQFKNFKTKYIRFSDYTTYIRYLHNRNHKIKKKYLLGLIEEVTINENLSLKKKNSKKLVNLLRIKRFTDFYIKIAPRFRIRLKTEIFNTRFIKADFYQGLSTRSWKRKKIISEKTIKFFLNKKKIYTRIKKKLLQSKALQYLTIIKNNSFIKFKKNLFSINDYMFLNFESLESYYLKFYTKEYEITTKKNLNFIKKKIFFFDFSVERLSTYREARKTHWNFFFKKTLKKLRYQKFLNLFLKKTDLFLTKIFTYFQFKFKFSYQFWVNFNLVYQMFFKVNSDYKQIFQLPIHKLFWRFLKKYSIHGLKSSIKISNWQSKKIKIKKTFWMQRKVKLPKYLKNKHFTVNGITNVIQYDFITNYFIILKSFSKIDHTNLFIFKNKFIKLHGFKYNS